MASTFKIPEQTPPPTWDVAFLFPPQGQWTEADYLALNTNHHVELSSGVLEIPEMPTRRHQVLVFFLCLCLRQFAAARRLGTSFLAPLPVRLWEGKLREPDVFFIRREHKDRIGEAHCGVPDLVMEVVSPGTRRLDQIIKAHEYAKAGIPEYWIVDPENETVSVLALKGTSYPRATPRGRGAAARSLVLPGFSLRIAEVMDAE